MHIPGQQYRRRRRIKMGQHIKLASSDPSGEVFEDIETTKNVSSEGFYFTTERELSRRNASLCHTAISLAH